MATPSDENKTSTKATTWRTAPAKRTTKSSPTTKRSTKKPINNTTKKSTKEAINSAEQIVNNAVEKVSNKVEQHVTPDLREKAEHFATKVEHFAEEVEAVGTKLEHFTDEVLPPEHGTKTVFSAEWKKPISRLFVFRFLWLILQWPIISIRSMWYSIITILHILLMLIHGERNKTLRDKQTRFRRHVIAWKAYICGIVDQRPELLVE